MTIATVVVTNTHYIPTKCRQALPEALVDINIFDAFNNPGSRCIVTLISQVKR